MLRQFQNRSFRRVSKKIRDLIDYLLDFKWYVNEWLLFCWQKTKQCRWSRGRILLHGNRSVLWSPVFTCILWWIHWNGFFTNNVSHGYVHETFRRYVITFFSTWAIKQTRIIWTTYKIFCRASSKMSAFNILWRQSRSLVSCAINKILCFTAVSKLQQVAGYTSILL